MLWLGSFLINKTVIVSTTLHKKMNLDGTLSIVRAVTCDENDLYSCHPGDKAINNDFLIIADSDLFDLTFKSGYIGRVHAVSLDGSDVDGVIPDGYGLLNSWALDGGKFVKVFEQGL